MPKKASPVTGVLEGNSDSKTRAGKQQNRYTFYTFTFFYEDTADIKLFENRLVKFCVKYYFGKETCPTTNRKHLQGFLTLKKPMRITELKELKCHLDNAKGSQDQNEEYCGKEGDVTKYGYPKPIKIIENLYAWQLEIEKIVTDSEPDGRTVHWYYDKIGNNGKSAFCKYMFIKHNCMVIRGGKMSDVVNIVYNTDMDKVPALIIDIPRKNGNSISHAAIECILDGMITNTKFETGCKCFNPPHVIIFSNFPPESKKDFSIDRWHITNINDDTDEEEEKETINILDTV